MSSAIDVEHLNDEASERHLLAAIAWTSTTDVSEALRLANESLVVPERLFVPAHREILATMLLTLESGKPASAVTISALLKCNKTVADAGGTALVSEILNAEGYADQIPACADSIRQFALRRLLVSIGHDLIGKARNLSHDPAAALSSVVGTLSGITLSKRTLRNLEDIMLDVVADFEDARAGKRRLVPTGFPSLDNAIGGWQPTLCVVGAMPGVGKSALFASTVHAMAKAGRKVGFFSLEDEARWLGWRLLSAESGVGQFYLRNEPLTTGQADAAEHGLNKIHKYARNVIVDDRSGLAPREVVQTARDMICNKGCECIIVDHLGELRFENTHGERYDLELAEGLSDLREIAKRYLVPVVVAAHLRRRPGMTPGAVPLSTDFANSAAIERQARLALGLSREPDAEKLTVHVLKQTNGRAGISVDLKFHGAAAMVRDCEGAEMQRWYETDSGSDR